MKALKMVLITLFAVAVILPGLITAAHAANFTCTVNSVGESGGVYYVYLTDNAATSAFSNRLFIISNTSLTEGDRNAMYATALTALASGLPVSAFLSDPPNAGTQCMALSVEAQ